MIAYLVVMLLVGLWHGAAWTFVLWGGLHGLYMGLETVFQNRRVRMLPSRLHPVIAHGIHIVLTFALVGFAWIFFRAGSLGDAAYIATHLLDFSAGTTGLAAPFTGRIAGDLALALAFASVALLVVVDVLDSRWGLNNLLTRAPGVLRWSLYYGATTIVLAALALANGTPKFIYFQF
jgi:D-alanyl-lipoteichoic acid acyltransferase DltB (MBOAT superfamily)